MSMYSQSIHYYYADEGGARISYHAIEIESE